MLLADSAGKGSSQALCLLLLLFGCLPYHGKQDVLEMML